jgi:hypothetical protein
MAVDYRVPITSFQWKGEESHGKKSREQERSKRIFGIFAFGFVV